LPSGNGGFARSLKGKNDTRWVEQISVGDFLVLAAAQKLIWHSLKYKVGFTEARQFFLGLEGRNMY